MFSATDAVTVFSFVLSVKNEFVTLLRIPGTERQKHEKPRAINLIRNLIEMYDVLYIDFTIFPRTYLMFEIGKPIMR